VVGVLSYLLSVGPVVGVVARVEPSPGKLERATEIVYAPLVFLAQRPPFRPVIRAYVMWWVELFRK
jgi:hypothetical protein